MTMRVHDLLDYWARRQPDATYVEDGNRRITWRQMRSWSLQVAAWLSAELAPGARFVLLDRNSPEMLSVYFGASRAGVVPVPLNYRLAPKEWEYMVADSGAELAVVHTEYATELAESAGALLRSGVVINGSCGTWENFAETIHRHPVRAADGVDAFNRDVSTESAFYQVYTSGTTGKPKGAVLSHRAICANAAQIVTAFGGFRSRSLTVMPIFHAGGAVSTLGYTAAGDSIRLVRDFVPDQLLSILADERIERATLVPAMIQMMLAQPISRKLNFTELRQIQYGASAISPSILRDAMNVYGCDFLQVYGMSELGALSTVLDPEDHRHALAVNPDLLTSAGRPAMGTEVRIVDSENEPLETGEVGEILIRGPQMMTEYWHNPEATAEALRDGWMHSGDAGRLDRDGYLYICDRVKDMIISGGENIYPREIEDVLTAHPGVAEAAVIGIPDERWGETPLAVVVPAPEAELTKDALVEHCRAHLARYKTPRSITFVDALPRNATGKVVKAQLRDSYWKGRTRAIN